MTEAEINLTEFLAGFEKYMVEQGYTPEDSSDARRNLFRVLVSSHLISSPQSDVPQEALARAIFGFVNRSGGSAWIQRAEEYTRKLLGENLYQRFSKQT